MLLDLLILSSLYFGIVFLLLFIEYRMGVRKICKFLSTQNLTLTNHRYHSRSGKQQTNGVRIETIYTDTKEERFYALFVFGSTGKLYRQGKETGKLEQVVFGQQR